MPFNMLLTYNYFEADTVVLTHIETGGFGGDSSLLPQSRPDILEKPTSKDDNLRMLLDMNGGVCEVVTGVTLGPLSLQLGVAYMLKLIRFAVYPILTAPGYQIKLVFFTLLLNSSTQWNFRSIDERTLVYFADCSPTLLESYASSGEGVDRAGGFAIQVTIFHAIQIYCIDLQFQRALRACWYARSKEIITTLLVSLLPRSSNS